MECSYRSCKRETLEGYKTCEVCRGKARKRQLDCLAQGLCQAGCGKAVVTKSLCRECADKRIAKRKIKLGVVLDHYGRECSCCGFMDIRFLTIDHIDNDGYLERYPGGSRLTGSNMHDKIIKEGFPSRFQILCWNCNCAKQFYGKGVCPHKEDSREV